MTGDLGTAPADTSTAAAPVAAERIATQGSERPWRLDILALTLTGHGHRVDLGAVRDCRTLWQLVAEAARADLGDEAFADLVRELVRLLPPAELVNRASLLDRGGIQVILLGSACRRERPPRRGRRELFVTDLRGVAA